MSTRLKFALCLLIAGIVYGSLCVGIPIALYTLIGWEGRAFLIFCFLAIVGVIIAMLLTETFDDIVEELEKFKADKAKTEKTPTAGAWKGE